MAIVQAIIAAISRSAGKVVNTAFGWATIMLFGKVSQDRQIYLSLISLGALAWIITVLGIAFPQVSTVLLSFVVLPAWVDQNWVRLAIFAAASVLPFLVGGLSIFLLDPADRPQGTAGELKIIVKGVPYTVGLSLTLLMMIVLAPVMKVADVLHRWTTAHVPVIVESDDYMDVVGELERALNAGGIHTTRHLATWMLRFPTRVLSFFAGGAIENLIAEQLTTLKSADVEFLLHPSDLVIRGKELDVARSRAIVAEQLAFSRAYLTWDKEANELEDRLRSIWRELRRNGSVDRAAAAQQIQDVGRDLRRQQFPYEEWEGLFRQQLLVERGVLQMAAGTHDHPQEPANGEPSATGSSITLGRSGIHLSPAAVLTGAFSVLLVLWRFQRTFRPGSQEPGEAPSPANAEREPVLEQGTTRLRQPVRFGRRSGPHASAEDEERMAA